MADLKGSVYLQGGGERLPIIVFMKGLKNARWRKEHHLDLKQGSRTPTSKNLVQLQDLIPTRPEADFTGLIS